MRLVLQQFFFTGFEAVNLLFLQQLCLLVLQHLYFLMF